MERVEKPWGWYEVLDEGEGYKVKKLHINEGERTSLQLHRNREERILVVAGVLRVDDGNGAYGDYKSTDGAGVVISELQVHRLEAKRGDVEAIEIQYGECDEDDIIRIEDKYGRC